MPSSHTSWENVTKHSKQSIPRNATWQWLCTDVSQLRELACAARGPLCPWSQQAVLWHLWGTNGVQGYQKPWTQKWKVSESICQQKSFQTSLRTTHGFFQVSRAWPKAQPSRKRFAVCTVQSFWTRTPESNWEILRSTIHWHLHNITLSVHLQPVENMGVLQTDYENCQLQKVFHTTSALNRHPVQYHTSADIHCHSRPGILKEQ